MKEMISFEEARSIVLDQSPRMDVESVPILQAGGKTLAAAIEADIDVPPFDNSAMDGFAVRAEDLAAAPCKLALAGDVRAGAVASVRVSTGMCVAITTGAPLPDGADAVVPIEWTSQVDAKTVQFERSLTVGKHVRRKGEDLRAGSAVLTPGRKLSPPDIGMLATVGLDQVPVRRAPRVAIVTTGDELVDIGQKPVGGQIRNSNLYALASHAENAGAIVISRRTAIDDEDAIEAAISESVVGSDIVILSGGVSVGEHDYVRKSLERAGATLLFWRVRQRPGKPLVFARRDNTLVFGLPGNPVSTSVCFEQYVRPAIYRMLAREHVIPKLYKAVLSKDMTKVKGLYYFARGVVTPDSFGRLHVRETGPQGSNIYSSMTSANAFIHLPEDAQDPAAGAEVLVQRLPWGQ